MKPFCSTCRLEHHEGDSTLLTHWFLECSHGLTFLKISHQGEVFIRTLPITLLQPIYNTVLNSKVIAWRTVDPDLECFLLGVSLMLLLRATIAAIDIGFCISVGIYYIFNIWRMISIVKYELYPLDTYPCLHDYWGGNLLLQNATFGKYLKTKCSSGRTNVFLQIYCEASIIPKLSKKCQTSRRRFKGGSSNEWVICPNSLTSDFMIRTPSHVKHIWQ